MNKQTRYHNIEKKDFIQLIEVETVNEIYVNGKEVKLNKNSSQFFKCPLNRCFGKQIRKILERIRKLRKVKTDYEKAKANKIILALDLDETLIRADIRPQGQSIKVHTRLGSYFVKKRPHLNEFLENMDRYFNLVLYTASLKEYADPIVDHIDPKGLIGQRYYREHCQNLSGIHYKDLRNICTDIDKILIIDNSDTGIILNPENGYQISSWFNDENDMELHHLVQKVQTVIFTPLTGIRDIINILR